MSSPSPTPNQLSVLDSVAMLIGVVVGIGIFGFPPLVALNVESHGMYMAVWLVGGVVMLIGALCYAELGSTYPHEGGEYHYLQNAFGSKLSMLFAWARGTVIQTGAIAAVCFIYGEYADNLLPLGPLGDAWHAAIGMIALTLLNICGTRESKTAQIWFTAIALLAMIAVIVAGVLGTPEQTAAAPAAPAPSGALGMALVFVLLTYGGWSEAAYLSGEIHNVRRNLSRILVLGTVIITTLYVCVNLAFLHIFGLEGLRNTHAVGADLMNLVAGPSGALLLSILICLTALATINGSIFTGARVYSALGHDVAALQWLGTRSGRGASPVNALLVQGAITLALIAFGALTSGSGVQTMVAYTAPVFWLFMGLVGLSIFVMRRREPHRERPFKVPFYPITPLVFCLSCAGLFYSSLMYAGMGGLIGLLVLLSGIPFMLHYGRTVTASAGANH